MSAFPHHPQKVRRQQSVHVKETFENILLEVEHQIDSVAIHGQKMFFRLRDPLSGDGVIEYMLSGIDGCLDKPSFREAVAEGPEKRKIFQRKNQIKKREEVTKIAALYLQNVLPASSSSDEDACSEPLPALVSKPLLPTGTGTTPSALDILDHIDCCIDCIDANIRQALHSVAVKLQAILQFIDNKINTFDDDLAAGNIALHENANKRMIYSKLAFLESHKLSLQIAFNFIESCSTEVSKFAGIAAITEEEGGKEGDDDDGGGGGGGGGGEDRKLELSAANGNDGMEGFAKDSAWK